MMKGFFLYKRILDYIPFTSPVEVISFTPILSVHISINMIYLISKTLHFFGIMANIHLHVDPDSPSNLSTMQSGEQPRNPNECVYIIWNLAYRLDGGWRYT